MRVRGCGLGLALCAMVATSLLAPGPASARRPATVLPRSLTLSLRLPASNGYAMSVLTDGHRQVSLIAQHGNRTAIYRTLGRVSREGIEADFGALGRIDVRIVDPTRKRRPPHSGCSGRDPIVESGSFRGRIAFSGEGGYVNVAAKRVPGSVRRSFRQVCPRDPRPAGSGAVVTLPRAAPPGMPALTPPGRGDGGFKLTLLAAVARTPDRTTSLLALQIGETRPSAPPPWTINAATFEREGRVAITRTAFAEAEDAQVEVSEAGVRPATATLVPPPPFRGSAAFDGSAPSATAWSGSLSVGLPGAGTVPLAGEGFAATLCRAAGIRAFKRCLGSLPSGRFARPPGG